MSAPRTSAPAAPPHARARGRALPDDLIGVHVASDLIVTGGAYTFAYSIRGDLTPRLGHVIPIEQFWWVPIVGAVAWLAALQAFGLYAGVSRLRRRDIVRGAALAAAAVALVLGFAIFLAQAKSFSRPVLGLYIIFGAVGVALERLLLRSLSARHEHGGRVRTLVAGTGARAALVLPDLEVEAQLGRREILGFLDADEEPSLIHDSRVIGRLDDLAGTLDREVVDEVVFALPAERLDRIDAAVASCEEVGVRASVLLPLDADPSRAEIATVGAAAAIRYERRPHRPLAGAAKRAFDIAAAAPLLILLAPFLAAIGALVRLTSRGPALFVQRRVGLAGREFSLYKLRTMEAGAEERRGELADRNECDGPVFKMRDDPRTTPLGRWLRRWSIDELPQLWNVLRGDMSLVGPRPPIPSEVARYERWHRRRLSVRPGITGLWQVSGRSDVGFAEWMRLDLAYIDGWSLGLDAKILLRTLGAVVARRGSY